MTPWDFLKIEQTDDIREIKRAYARQLRIYSPESNPEGFMRLREAYELALESVKTPGAPVRPIMPLQPDIDRSESPLPSPFDLPLPPLQPDIKEQEPSLHTHVWSKVEELYSDLKRRMDLDEWQRLFDILNVDEFLILKNGLIAFLNDHYVLPVYVWIYLDAEMEFDSSFRWMFLLDAEKNIYTPMLEMFLSASAAFDFDAFIKLHINARLEYHCGRFEEAEKCARKAINIYDGDYHIFKILGDCLLEQKDHADFEQKKHEAAGVYEKSTTMCWRFTIDKEGTITACDRRQKSAAVPMQIFIPHEVDGVSVKIIGEKAFSTKGFTSVTIPDGVTSIRSSAFTVNKLTSVTIPASVTYIGDFAFQTNKLTKITIPDGVTYIGDRAFCSNSLTSITIGDNVSLSMKDHPSFENGFDEFYKSSKKAGTYILGDGKFGRKEWLSSIYHQTLGILKWS